MSTPGLHLVCTIVHQLVFIYNGYAVYKKCTFESNSCFASDVDDDRSDSDSYGGDSQQPSCESNL